MSKKKNEKNWQRLPPRLGLICVVGHRKLTSGSPIVVCVAVHNLHEMKNPAQHTEIIHTSPSNNSRNSPPLHLAFAASPIFFSASAPPLHENRPTAERFLPPPFPLWHKQRRQRAVRVVSKGPITLAIDDPSANSEPIAE